MRLMARDVLLEKSRNVEIGLKSIFDTNQFGSNTLWRNTMHRHLIAGALACFGSSLFGQSDSTANQAQGALNKVQNTLQN